MHKIKENLPGRSKGLLLLALVLSLALPIVSLRHYPQHSVDGFPLGFPRSSPGSLSLASLASANPYDEQIGITFTQNFSKLAFNVTAVASHSYRANGSIFVGLQSSLSSELGFFTGLMTEQYHSSPYYGTGLPVTYNETEVTLSSAWMWMDEWNTDTGQSVFRDNTTEPVQLDNSLSQYFSSNGTAEIANAYGLVTGLTPVTFPTLNAAPQVTGYPRNQTAITTVIRDPQGATVRFENLTISTSFGKYNISVTTLFSFSVATAQYNATISLPADLTPGNYKLTI